MKIFGKEITLIEDCKSAWKLWSIQVLFLLGCMPDFFNALSAMGMLDDKTPEPVVITVRILAAIGIFLRVVKQKNQEQ